MRCFMNKGKIIEEMAKIIAKNVYAVDEPNIDCMPNAKNASKELFNAGYRKERQGEWITDEYFETIYCSLCNGLAPVDCEKERFYQSNYCPECGAHMKGAE